MIKYIKFLVLAPVLVGCGVNYIESEKRKLSNYLVISLPKDPLTYDPAFVIDSSSHDMVKQLFRGLVKLDENSKVVPDLAEKIEVSKDGLVYSFIVGSSLFSDGTPVDSESISRSLRRNLRVSEYAREFLPNIKRIYSEQGKVVIELTKAYGSFLERLSYPTNYITKETPEERIRMPKVFSGNYVIDYIVPRFSVKLKANPYAKVHHSTLFSSTLPSNDSVVNKVLTGLIDVTPIDQLVYDALEGRNIPGRIETVPMANVTYLIINPKFIPDVNMRRSIASVVNRKELNDMAFHGQHNLADAFVPKVNRSWGTNLPIYVKSTLPDIQFQLSYNDGAPQNRIMAELLYNQFSKAGLNINIRKYGWPIFLDKANKNELDMYIAGWNADFPSPESYLRDLFHSKGVSNKIKYNNPRFDELIDKEDYKAAETILLEDAVAIPLLHGNSRYFISNKAKNIKINSMGIMRYEGTMIR